MGAQRIEIEDDELGLAMLTRPETDRPHFYEFGIFENGKSIWQTSGFRSRKRAVAAGRAEYERQRAYRLAPKASATQ